jgi:hypothetical protein
MTPLEASIVARPEVSFKAQLIRLWERSLEAASYFSKYSFLSTMSIVVRPDSLH